MTDIAFEPTRNETVNVGASSTVISRAKYYQTQGARKVIIVRNISANAASIITVNLGANAAVAEAGIVLRQYESFTDSTGDNYECYQGEITAICVDANGKVAIFER